MKIAYLGHRSLLDELLALLLQAGGVVCHQTGSLDI